MYTKKIYKYDITIKCDNEGKISSCANNKNIYKYEVSELVNKNRIFILFSRYVVLDVIKKWNTLKVDSKTTFNSLLKGKCNKDIFVNVTITKNINNNLNLIEIRQCNDELAKNLIKKPTIRLILQRYSAIIRAQFLLGTLIPLLFGIVWSTKYISIKEMNICILLAIFIGTICLHISANTFNDYYDWKSSTDKINKNYLLFITGGSRSIELELITESNLFKLSTLMFIVASISGIYVSIMLSNLNLLLMGLIGGFGSYFYTAPPIKLSSRIGMGELFHIICLGPLIVFSLTYALTGFASISNFIVGIPIGLLITACLCINEYPDIKSDLTTGKKNIVAYFGPKIFPYIFSGIILLAYISVILSIITLELEIKSLIVLISAPIAISNIKKSFMIVGNNKQYIKKLCLNTFVLYITFNALFIISLII